VRSKKTVSCSLHDLVIHIQGNNQNNIFIFKYVWSQCQQIRVKSAYGKAVITAERRASETTRVTKASRHSSSVSSVIQRLNCAKRGGVATVGVVSLLVCLIASVLQRPGSSTAAAFSSYSTSQRTVSWRSALVYRRPEAQLRCRLLAPSIRFSSRRSA
jgi:hypothetical protein